MKAFWITGLSSLARGDNWTLHFHSYSGTGSILYGNDRAQKSFFYFSSRKKWSLERQQMHWDLRIIQTCLKKVVWVFIRSAGQVLRELRQGKLTWPTLRQHQWHTPGLSLLFSLHRSRCRSLHTIIFTIRAFTMGPINLDPRASEGSFQSLNKPSQVFACSRTKSQNKTV